VGVTAMEASEPDLIELNKLISNIRRSVTLPDLLNNLLSACSTFLGAEAAFVFLVDEHKRIITFANKEVKLKENNQKYPTHPMDKIADLCGLIHGRDKFFLRTTLKSTKDETSSIYDVFFLPTPVSVLAVPIYSDELQPIGVITLMSQREDAFTVHRKDLLTIVAQQTAASIEKVLKIEQYNKIVSVSKILLEDFDFNKLVEKLKELYGAYRCSIFVRTIREGKEIYALKATTDETLDEEHVGEIFYLSGEGLTGGLADKKTCLRVYNVADSQELREKLPGAVRNSKFREEPPAVGQVPESFLGCSLNLLGEAIGVISLVKREPASYFSPYDEQSLLLLSNYIATRMGLEERIAQTEATRELNFLSQQISYFAHDAKNSYSTLSGYLQTVLDWIPRSRMEDPSAKRMIAEVKRLRQLTALYIEKMTSILKQRGPVKIHRKIINLKHVVDELVEMLSKKLQDNNILTSITIPDDLVLDFDAQALQQVFLNLIMNSSTSMRIYKQGRLIAIEAREVFDEKKRTTYIEISYEDDGPGIASEYFTRIFERGFSLTGGSGLGLAITKSIIEAHHGNIRVVAKKKRGAKFIIEVPKTFVKGS
jgi:signal transduction histidine kinase